MEKGTEELHIEKYTTKTDKVTEEVQTIRYTIKKFLELIREIFDADACHLYLINTEMDISEKEGYIRDTISSIKENYNKEPDDQRTPEEIKYKDMVEIFEKFESEHSIDAKILKFIDVAEKDNEKNWKYDYKNRPAKYVIFNKYKDDKRTILKEGLTAYIARAREIVIFNSDEQVSLHKSSASLNVAKNIIPASQMMIGFPLINSKKNVIGVLKVENYLKGEYNYNIDHIKVKEVREYLPLFVRLIESSEDHFRTNSYKELFRGMKLLDNLTELQPIILNDRSKGLLILLLKSLKGYFLTNSPEELSKVKDLLKELEKIDDESFKEMGRIEPNLLKYMGKKIEYNSSHYLKTIKCPKENRREVSDLLENFKKIEIYELISENFYKSIEKSEKMDFKKIHENIDKIFNEIVSKELENLFNIKNSLNKNKERIEYPVLINKDVRELFDYLEELEILVKNQEEVKKYKNINRITGVIKHVSDEIKHFLEEKTTELEYSEQFDKGISDLLECIKKIKFYIKACDDLIGLKLNNKELVSLENPKLNLLEDHERDNCCSEFFNKIKESFDNLKRIRLNLLEVQKEAKYSDEINKEINESLEHLKEIDNLFEHLEVIENHKIINEKISSVTKIMDGIKPCLEEKTKQLEYCEQFNTGISDLLENTTKIEFYIITYDDIIDVLEKENIKELFCPEKVNERIYTLLETRNHKEIYNLVENLKKIKPELLNNLHCTKFKAGTNKDVCDENSSLDPKVITYPEEINKKIFEATLHLFLVLKRNEYIGYDEILDRVSEYATEVTELLDLKGDMTRSFKEFLEEVRKHEELLLCGLNDYRDHFMHQFHVFVSGYIIINKLGIDIFRSRIQNSMNYILGKKKLGFELSNSDVLRIWFLAAFYHDYAYILEKIDKELETFFKDVLGYPFNVKFNWEQLLKKDSEFPKYLNYLVKFFSSKKETNPGTLLRNYLDSIIEVHDHGVLSALLLIYYNSKATQKRFNECLYAAQAISLHNKPVYENLTEANKRRISFESFPIAFLLAYCDTAQSFGRLEGKEHVESSDYPVSFSGIEVIKNEGCSIMQKTKIICKLEYICGQLHKIPRVDMLERWAKDIHNVFNSEEYLFEIEYYKKGYSEDEKKLIYTLSFH